MQIWPSGFREDVKNVKILQMDFRQSVIIKAYLNLQFRRAKNNKKFQDDKQKLKLFVCTLYTCRSLLDLL